MKTLLIFVAFMIAGICSAHAESFIQFENPPLTRQEVAIYKVLHHIKPIRQYADNKAYIYNDKASVNDRFNRLIDNGSITLPEKYKKGN